MFQTLNDVPAPIQEFYSETTTQVPTGNFYTEFYYEDGVRKSREVEYLRDVVTVTENPREDLKNWVYVQAISDDTTQFKIYCIEKACEAERWDYHDAYLTWFENKPNEEDTEALAEWQSSEPQADFTDAQTLINELTQRVAKVARDIGRYAPITVDGLTYDATQEAYDNLQGMVNSWDTLIVDPTLIESGIVSEGQMYWTLADNTNVLVTKDMLEAVVTAIRVRAGLLHAQYQAEKANEVNV